MFKSAYVYGLHVKANTPMPQLPGASSVPFPDIQIFLHQTPTWLKANAGVQAETVFVSPETDEHHRPFFIVSKLLGGDFYRLCYCDGANFIVDRAGTQIWVEWPDTLAPEEISTYLFGPVIGWVLRLRGCVCLHASAIAIDGRAVAFVGASGTGKSTTAAAFANRGYAVLADDVVAISGPPDSLLVTPSYPELRLWPESMAALYGHVSREHEHSATTEKFHVDVRAMGQEYQDAPLPLAAIYILNDEDHSGANQVRPLSHREALIILVANTHAGRLLDRTAREEEFELLASLVARVRVSEVFRGTDLEQLPVLCDAILSDMKAHPKSVAVMEATEL